MCRDASYNQIPRQHPLFQLQHKGSKVPCLIVRQDYTGQTEYRAGVMPFVISRYEWADVTELVKIGDAHSCCV